MHAQCHAGGRRTSGPGPVPRCASRQCEQAPLKTLMCPCHVCLHRRRQRAACSWACPRFVPSLPRQPVHPRLCPPPPLPHPHPPGRLRPCRPAASCSSCLGCRATRTSWSTSSASCCRRTHAITTSSRPRSRCGPRGDRVVAACTPACMHPRVHALDWARAHAGGRGMHACVHVRRPHAMHATLQRGAGVSGSEQWAQWPGLAWHPAGGGVMERTRHSTYCTYMRPNAPRPLLTHSPTPNPADGIPGHAVRHRQVGGASTESL